MTIPRSEHPKPQFEREKWLNLNGEWDFAFDFSVSGMEKGWSDDPKDFTEKILVPFCPESQLSGIGFTDFILSVWYHRQFVVPDDWSGQRVLLHFGAVDFDCHVWVNGQLAGRHVGGNASFSFDISDLLVEGENRLIVNAIDDVRSGKQPTGKQSHTLRSKGCNYTRTTGIWQTVWLEAVPTNHLQWVHVVPDLDNGCFYVQPKLSREQAGLQFRAVLKDGDQQVAEGQVGASSGVVVPLQVETPRTWSPKDPFLYDLTLELLHGGKVVDQVCSYAGLRKIHIEGNRFYLNNEPIFLRFVLDQGFYPDGIWTAPDDAALRKDIELGQAAGFHGARIHQKVFEERYLYWADRLGYLTWGEYCNRGMDFGQLDSCYTHQQEWRDTLIRDRNHPSIIGWTPFNETAVGAREHGPVHRRVLTDIYDLTRELDPTRPVNDASGYVHVKTDIYTVHDYTQDPDSLYARYQLVDPKNPGQAWANHAALAVPYQGQPYVVDEYGGTYWTSEHEDKPEMGGNREKWGFGKSSKDIEDLVEKLTNVLLENPNIAGYTYTQLTDVEQEVNGIYTYDRKPKFDIERLQKIFSAPAAIERE